VTVHDDENVVDADQLTKAVEEMRNTMAIDPVCGMQVDPGTARHMAEHQGQTYYFCAPGCKKAFEADPAKYLSPEHKPSM
jgi:Cu+-exporting ATPase